MYCELVQQNWPTKLHRFNEVDLKIYDWENKPILENSVIVWDIKTVAFSQLATIKAKLEFTPESSYIVIQKNLFAKAKQKILKDYGDLFNQHISSFDGKIIATSEFLSHYSNVILVSSNHRFYEVVNKLTKTNQLQWIFEEHKTKHISMRANLASMNLKLTPITERTQQHAANDKKCHVRAKSKRKKK